MMVLLRLHELKSLLKIGRLRTFSRASNWMTLRLSTSFPRPKILVRTRVCVWGGGGGGGCKFDKRAQRFVTDLLVRKITIPYPPDL